MDPLRAIIATEGVVLRREILGCGYDDKAIGRSLRAGVLHRVRHGAYCFGNEWARLSPEERHLVLARAVLRTTPGPVVLSHVTALVAHGIAVWGADLTRVHVTRLDEGAGRQERDVVHHVGLVPHERDVVLVGGLPVTTPARAAVESATLLPTESALVSVDHALHLGHCTPDDLHRLFARLNHWPGSQHVHVVLNLADGRSESPGETRSRHLFWRAGLPRPLLQWEVRDEAGRLVGTTDFAWPDQCVFGEFDGRVKYGRLLREGESPGDAVFREKQREDRIRELTGYRCGRLVWADLGRPRETAARFARLLGLAPVVVQGMPA